MVLAGCSGEVYTAGGDGGGSGGGGPKDGGTASSDGPIRLVVTPSNQTIFIDTSKKNTPAKLTYKALLGSHDVSSTARFAITPSTLGTFSGPTFSSVLDLPGGARGATGTVKAVANGQSGRAKLTIVELRKTPDAKGKRDFYFVVPYKKPPTPKRDVLEFSTDIQKVDVAFVMDTTASMSGEISNLTTQLATTIIPGLSSIPSVGFSVVDFRDWTDAWTVMVRQVVTTSIAKSTAAVQAMSAHGGGDGPEAQLAAMHYTLTGQANRTIPSHTPGPGTTGGVDFRKGAVPVLVLITDASWHDPSGIATMANVIAAFKSASARFVSILTGSGAGPQPVQLSDATKSDLPASAFGGTCGAKMCCTGPGGAGVPPSGPGSSCRLNFLASSNGSGVSSSIVSAIKAISVGSSYDISARLSNDSSNAGGVDATKFIQAVRAMDKGDKANGCGPHAAKDTDNDGVKDTFVSVTVGTPVCFEVIPKANTTVEPKEAAQFFNAYINMIGNPGNVDLGDKRTIVFLVPPKDVAIQ